uniref:Uncharacterized protein n=1 Tax=Ascaris lumbricoides TaxID=6252 RepID=A0A0M3IRT2_ASCLU
MMHGVQLFASFANDVPLTNEKTFKKLIGKRCFLLKAFGHYNEVTTHSLLLLKHICASEYANTSLLCAMKSIYLPISNVHKYNKVFFTRSEASFNNRLSFASFNVAYKLIICLTTKWHILRGTSLSLRSLFILSLTMMHGVQLFASFANDVPLTNEKTFKKLIGKRCFLLKAFGHYNEVT